MIFKQSKKEDPIKKDIEKELGKVLSRDSDIGWGSKSLDYKEYSSELFRTKGLDIVDKMVRSDAQVKNSYFIRRLCILATGRDLVPGDDSPEGKEQQEFMDEVFKQMKGSVEDFILKISDAIRCGFKVAEIVYKYLEDGPHAGKVGIGRLLVRNSKNYKFDTDDAGNLKPKGLIEDPGGANEQPLPVDKFIIWTYGRFDDDATSLYGMPEFEAAYKYFYANDITLRFWALCLEKNAKPLWKVEVKEGHNPTTEEVDNLLSTLTNIHRKSAIKIPIWAIVERVDPPVTKEEAYEKFMNFNNQMISKALLLGTLIQQEGSLRGSYALGKKQFDLFYLNNRQIMAQIEEEVFYEQLIKKIIDINFEKPIYPRFKLIDPDDPEVLESKAKILAYLRNIPGLELQEEEIREWLGLPNLTNPEEDTEKKKPEPKLDQELEDDPAEEKPKEYAQDAIFSRKKLPQEEIVKYADWIRIYDQLPQMATAELSNAFQSEMAKVIKKLKKDGKVDYDTLKEIKINPAPIQKAYENLGKRAYYAGLRMADNEVARHLNQVSQFAVDSGIEIDTDELDLKVELSQELLEAAARRLNANAYLAGATEAGKLSQDAEYMIFQSIENKWELTRLIAELEVIGATRAMATSVLTGFQATTSRIYNQARVDLFASTDEVAGHLYSAILDNRTTELCRELDGRMWRKDDDGWMHYIPPNHFFCRSIIVPVFRGDEPPEWDLPPDGLEPAEGFGGPAGSVVRPARSIQHPGYE